LIAILNIQSLQKFIDALKRQDQRAMVNILCASAILLALCGCGTVQITEKGEQVRALTEMDKPVCIYLSNVVSRGGDYFSSYDWNFEAGFNAAMNAVAAAGGNAYSIVRSNETGEIYEMEVWLCEWRKSQISALRAQLSEPQEITEEQRGQCEYVKTVVDGSNWGITKSNNYKGARKEVLKLIQEAGADSFFVVHKLENRYGVGLIVEAWNCN
jgi:hypothetical protein